MSVDGRNVPRRELQRGGEGGLRSRGQRRKEGEETEAVPVRRKLEKGVIGRLQLYFSESLDVKAFSS